MRKKYPGKSYLLYSTLAGVMYAVAAFFYVSHETFLVLWILFLGNVCFGLCLAAFIIFYKSGSKDVDSIRSMIAVGHITTGLGIIVATVLSLLLFFIIPQHAFASRHTGSAEALHSVAPQLSSGENHQQLLALMVDVIFGNFVVGSFITTLLSYTTKQKDRFKIS